VDENYTVQKMLSSKRAMNDGQPLSPEQKAEVVEMAEKIKQAEDKYNEYVKQAEERIRKLEAQHAADELKIAAAREAKADSASGTDRDLGAERDSIIEGLGERSNEALRDLRPWIRKLALNFVRSGITERDPLINAVHDVLKDIFPHIELRDTMDAISGYGDFRPLDPEAAKAKLRDLSGQMQNVSKLEDLLARRALQKTGPERKVPTDEERRLIKLVNEYKKRYGVTVTDPATQLKSALAAVKTRLTNQIKDLEFQISTGKKIVKGNTKVAYDAEATALEARRDALKEQFDEIFGKPELTDEQRVAMATKAVERSIVDLQKRIAAGDIGPRTIISKTPETPALKALRDQRDVLQAQLQELRDIANPAKTPEQKSLDTLKTRLRTQVMDYNIRLARGDLSPPVKRSPVALDPEALRLQRIRDYNRARFQESLAEDRFNKLSKPAKVWERAKSFLDLSRSLITSFDLSAVLRQGKFIVAGHPIRGARAIPEMIASFASKDRAYAAQKQIEARPNYPRYKQSGLFIAEEGARVSKMEENYIMKQEDLLERSLGRVPIAGKALGALAGGSQRAYVTYLNRLRADSFDAMAESLSRHRPVTDVEAKAISNFVNAATGRGSLGGTGPLSLERAATALNRVFFSPRYFASRMQLILGQPFYKGTARTRGLIAEEYAKTLIGYAVFYTLAKMALPDSEVETNPLSTDAGKIKIGNTRIDPLAGIQQNTVLLSRTATGDQLTLNGQLKPMDAEAYGRFLRNKLAPLPGAAVDLFRYSRSQYMNRPPPRDATGKEINPLGIVQGITVPLAWNDIIKAAQDQGLPRGSILAILSLLGEGVQVYEPR
jgi:hypothetical protein